MGKKFSLMIEMYWALSQVSNCPPMV